MREIYYSANPTPIPYQNPAWSEGSTVQRWLRDPLWLDTMRAGGLQPMWLPGEGQFNQSSRWSASGQLRTAADVAANGISPIQPQYVVQPDESPDAKSQPASFAASEQQSCEAISRLALYSRWFDAPPVTGAAPMGVILDLETPDYSTDDPAAALRTIDRLTQIAAWMRAVNPNLELGVYGLPKRMPEALSSNAMDQLASHLDFAVCYPYTWDEPALSPQASVQAIEKQALAFKARWPELQPIAVMCPVYEILNKANAALRGLDQTPAPLGTWQHNCKFAMDQGFDVVLWLPPDLTFPTLPEYVSALARANQ